MKRPPLPSKRLTCRYCGRAFALPAAAFRHRDVCSAKMPAKAVERMKRELERAHAEERMVLERGGDPYWAKRFFSEFAT